jgi:putative polyketide hydroxylase
MEARGGIVWGVRRLASGQLRPDYARYADDALGATPLLDPIAVELGELYRSSIIDNAGSDLPVARLPEEWQGQPGTRAPHRAVLRVGKSLSTLDLYGAGWVLVSGAQAWCEAATHMQERTGIAVTGINLRRAFGDQDGALIEQDLGIGNRGASLVRPDGVIAWRSLEQSDERVDALERAVRMVALPMRTFPCP